MNKGQRTYQARLSVEPNADTLLSAYASIFSKAEHTLFAKLQSGGDLTALKREFLPEFGITARQFNAMSAEVKGKITSIKEHRKELIKESMQRIVRAKGVLKKITDSGRRHQKKRRLAILQTQLSRLKEDQAAGKVRLCFGSKKLFTAQFHLDDNGYASHEEWLTDWQAARKRQFFVIGSKDETAGCQSCVATVTEDGSIKLRPRLPDTLADKGKYVTLTGLNFNHGHREIVAAVGRNLSDNKSDWQAISYRFLKDDKGWRVFITVGIPAVKCISLKNTGVIGLDINVDHFALTETDRHGNPIEFISIPCVTYGKTAEQRKAIIGDAGKQVIAFATEREKPLVIEKLDFQKKKSALEKQSPQYARMLSSLAYTQVQSIIRARAFDAGIEICEVNPAFTSVIGQYKFKDRYGMSRHHAAALAIGRRSLGFGESLPSQLHVTLLRPEDRGRHVWSKWAAVSRKASAAHAAHRRSGSPRSSPSPVSDKARLVIIPPAMGEIPICESSLELFE